MEVLENRGGKKIPHKHPLTAMIWTNEEGSLYPPAMMCSGIVCYDYLPEDIRSGFQYEDMMNSKVSWIMKAPRGGSGKSGSKEIKIPSSPENMNVI